MNKRDLGNSMEKVAADYLVSQGLKIVENNYRCRIGEIDIIAVEENEVERNPYDRRKTYVFVEVKYRKDAKKGLPYEAVDYKKRNKIINVARLYGMTKGGLDGYNIRFDVISILDNEITWYKNAFMSE